MYASGAVCAVLVSQAFWWKLDMCFGTFAVTDDITTLQWYGDDGFIRFAGLAGMLAAVLSLLGAVVFFGWRRRRTRVPAAVRQKSCLMRSKIGRSGV